MRVYIAGKISGLNYEEVYNKFENAEKKLQNFGLVINPCKIVPEESDWDSAMDICLSALSKCDTIYLLSDWKESKGAMIEKAKAEELGLNIYEEVVLTNYQKTIATQATKLLHELHIAYLAMEMRTGKTLTSLAAAEISNKKSVLFITKKKAIKSIENDFKNYNFACQLRDYPNHKQIYKLKVINDHFSNIEKEKPEYDCYIVDESHVFSAYPVASSRTKFLKKLVKKSDLIMLSGTPSPETYGSQLFHQFYLSEYNPFNLDSFYKWAKLYVNIKEKFISGVRHNDYSDAKKDEIMKVVGKYFITYTQEEAGFKENITEIVHNVEIDKRIYSLINILRRDKMYQFHNSEEVIICDTPVKEQNKIHQLCSGTIITEGKEYKILDYSKANYIKEKFVGRKIAIFYQFQAEGEALKKIFSNCTSSPEEFNQSADKIFICQVQSGSMGVNLSTADDLIFYNINFSAVQYQQARARLSDRKRIKPILVHWIFSKEGIEQKIYQAVIDKKDYTSQFYRKDYGETGKQNPKRNISMAKVA